MPVFNSAAFLERAVNSVLTSSFNDLELILVDDGSTDGSDVLCDQLMQTDSRIRVIHKANGGVASARNKGLDSAEGDYIAFLDSDDYVSPVMYEKLIGELEKGYDLALCNFMMHYNDRDVPENTVDVGATRIDTIKNLFLSGVGGGSVYMVSRRSTVNSLRFPEYLKCGEDLWFVLRLLYSTEMVSKVDEPLYYYNRENDQSLTHTLNTIAEESLLRGMKENQAFLTEANLFDEVKNEFYWHVLRFKTLYALDPDRFDMYRSVFPEANSYKWNNPLLSNKMKAIMTLIDLHLDFIVKTAIRNQGKK